MSEYIEENPKWGFKKQVGFRFIFIYFLLFIVHDMISRLGILLKNSIEIYSDIILWVGYYIFNIPHKSFFQLNGITDTTYNYVALFCVFMGTILFVVIWTILDRQRKNYELLYYWFTVVLRFYIAIILINYGLVKLVYLQFPEPSLFRLTETYGNSSPMGLAWTFLGYSKGYNVFMGIAEIMSLLILFRRTLTFGLVITFAVIINVMAINFFYDIPLKIFTTHLTLITVFLLSHDFKNLFTFFFTNKKVSLKLIRGPKFLNNVNYKKAIIVFKSVILISIFILAAIKLNKRDEIFNGEFSKSKFYGIHDVLSFKRNGVFVPLDNRLDIRWRYLIMQYEGWVQLVDSENNSFSYTSKIDTTAHSIKLVNVEDVTDNLELKYKKLKNNRFIFKSTIKGDSIEAMCRILKKSDFLLMNREFNLINEVPFNR